MGAVIKIFLINILVTTRLKQQGSFLFIKLEDDISLFKTKKALLLA